MKVLCVLVLLAVLNKIDANKPTKAAAIDLPPPEKVIADVKDVGSVGFSKRGCKITYGRKNSKVEISIKGVEVNGTKFGKANEVDFKIIKSSNDTSYSIKAKRLEVQGRLTDKANMSLSYNMFMENGTITGDDGNDYDVTKGSLKFNLILKLKEDYGPICVYFQTRCKDGSAKAGKKLKKIRGKKGEHAKRSPETHAVCEKARMTFSSVYKNAGQYFEMDEGYPKIDLIGGWSVSKLCFRGKDILYDPVVEAGDDVGEENTADEASTTDGNEDVDSSSYVGKMSMVLFLFTPIVHLVTKYF